MQTLKIEAYNLADFAKALQQAFEQGYRLDLETNANYPTSFGTYFYAGLVKPTTNATNATNAQQAEEKKPTRKAPASQ